MAPSEISRRFLRLRAFPISRLLLLLLIAAGIAHLFLQDTLSLYPAIRRVVQSSDPYLHHLESLLPKMTSKKVSVVAETTSRPSVSEPVATDTPEAPKDPQLFDQATIFSELEARQLQSNLESIREKKGVLVFLTTLRTKESLDTREKARLLLTERMKERGAAKDEKAIQALLLFQEGGREGALVKVVLHPNLPMAAKLSNEALENLLKEYFLPPMKGKDYFQGFKNGLSALETQLPSP